MKKKITITKVGHFNINVYGDWLARASPKWQVEELQFLTSIARVIFHSHLSLMRMSLCSFCSAKSYTKPYGKWNFRSNHQNYLSHSVRRLLKYFSTLPAVHRRWSTKISPVKADGCVISFLSAYHLSCILCFFLTLSRSPTLSQLVVIRGEVLWEFEGGGLWPDSSMHHQFTLSLLGLIAPLRGIEGRGAFRALPTVTTASSKWGCYI